VTWIFYALVAAVFYAIYYLIFYKSIHKEHALEYLGVMASFIVVLSFPLAKDISFQYSTGTWVWLYIISLLLVMFFFFLAQSLKHRESSEVAPLMNLSLILIVVLSVLILHEKISLKNIAGIALMMTGSYIIEIGFHVAHLKKILKKFRTKYITYVFMAIVAASLIVLFEKIALNPQLVQAPIDKVTPEALFFLTRIGMALNFIILLCFKQNSVKGIRHALKSRVLPIIIIAIFNIAANYIYYLALQDGPVSLVVTLASLSTLLVVFIGGELFHEHKLQQKLLATIVMILATYLIIM